MPPKNPKAARTALGRGRQLFFVELACCVMVAVSDSDAAMEVLGYLTLLQSFALYINLAITTCWNVVVAHRRKVLALQDESLDGLQMSLNAPGNGDEGAAALNNPLRSVPS